MNKEVLKKLPSIPEYFMTYVDPQINLENTSHIPCPFHDEKTGKSFSYSSQLGIFRCFGSCHTGGDVVALHQLNYHIKSKKEALDSLCSLYGITNIDVPDFTIERACVDENEVYRRRILAAAMHIATTPDDWVDLDYIVSKYPYDVKELETFCACRGMLIKREEPTYAGG